MRIKLTRAIRKPPWLEVWSGMVSVAVTIALLLTFLPMQVSVNTDGILSISLRQASANPDWLSGYDYRKQITIDGSTAGVQTNYQMGLRIAKDIFESITYSGAEKHTSNPIFEPGASGQWDDDKVVTGVFMVDEGGNAVQESGEYIWYYGGYDGTNWKIGRATTSNGINFTKYGSNPVLDLGGVGDFDEDHVSVGAVIKHGTSDYEMFYEGHPASGTNKLGRATSTDGLSWTKDDVNNPLVDVTSWTNCVNMAVVHVILASDDGYKLFFEGVKSGDSGFSIWAGNSSDGISWTALNSGNRILNKSAGEWDAHSVANPRVTEVIDGYYLMGYNGCVDSDAEYKLAFATSTDLISWTKRSENPVVGLGSGGSWDDYRIETILILKQEIGVGGNLQYWYYGCPDKAKTNASIGYGWIPQASVYVSTCQDDFDDIRFTQSDGSTELDFWQEGYVSGEYADFWIEFNSIAASPSSSTFYIYYDNSGASPASSGTDTFIQYHGAATASFHDSDVTVADSDLRYRAKVKSVSVCDWGIGNQYDRSDDAIVAITHYGSDYRYLFAYSEGVATYSTSSPKFSDGAWHIVELEFLAGTSLYGYVDGAEIATHVSSGLPAGESMGLIFNEVDEGGEQEWSFIGNFCDPEPTWGTMGSEETLSAEITNTPDTWSIGIVAVGSSSNTTIDYFAINNTGNCPVDITIQGTNLTAGDDTWELAADATPGENIYGLMAGLDDGDDLFDTVVNLTANTFVTNLAEAVTQNWGLNMSMPTSLSGFDGNNMTGTVTLVASAA